MRTDDRPRAVTTRDESIIDTLARETGGEPAHIRELYEREMSQLEATAKVHGFLSLIACRNVRMAMRHADSDRGAQ